MRSAVGLLLIPLLAGCPTSGPPRTDGSPAARSSSAETALPPGQDASTERETESLPAEQQRAEKLKAAREIRAVVQQFLHDSPEKARSHLPADWAPALPLEVGPVALGGTPNLIGLWQFDLKGDHAQLDYHPPGSVTAHDRFWFRIKLVRKSGAWEIVPPGVSFVHTWAKER